MSMHKIGGTYVSRQHALFNHAVRIIACARQNFFDLARAVDDDVEPIAEIREAPRRSSLTHTRTASARSGDEIESTHRGANSRSATSPTKDRACSISAESKSNQIGRAHV